MAPHHARGALEVQVLGPATVAVAGDEVPLRPRERAVVAALALHAGRVVDADALLSLVWGADLPASGRKAVHNQIARIRRAAGDGLVRTVASGYGLAEVVDVDVLRFRNSLTEARAAAKAMHHERQAAALREALLLWRGRPYAELHDELADGPRARLDEERRQAEEELAAALLALGDPSAPAMVEQLVVDQPYRERRWRLLALARYRAGLRRDAALALVDARTSLAEVGLEPSNDLNRLAELVAVDDPVLLTEAPLALAITSGDVAPPAASSDCVVGREDEARRLAEVVERARTGVPVALLVTGEAGVGKTTLLRVGARRAAESGTTVLWGSCDAQPAVPLAPLVQLLEELAALDPDFLLRASGPHAAVLATLSPRLKAHLAGVADAPVEGSQLRLFDAITRVLAAAARERDLVVVLDDVHLAPPTTRRLLDHVLGGAVPFAVLAAARPGGTPLRGEIMELGGLTTDQVGEHLAHLLGKPVDHEAAAWVHQLSGGNPLFVTELAQEMRTTGALHEVDGTYVVDPSAEVPSALRQLLLARLDGVARDVRTTLEAAAVLGHRFSTDDLARMVDGAPVHLAEAVRAGVVERDGARRFAFRHQVLRDAIYDELAEGLRLELHEAAAAALEQRGARAGDVASHHLALAAIAPGRAVASATRAAREALDAHAYAEAAALARDAREVARDQLVDRELACELSVMWGGALRQAGDPASTPVLIDAADEADALGDGDLLARAALALCQLGPTTAAGSADEDAARVADRALERVTDIGLRAEVAGAASLLHSLAGDAGRCRQLFEDAQAGARALGDPWVLGRVLPYAYLALAGPDDLERRQEIADEVVGLGARLGHLTTEWEGHHLRFSVLLQRGDPALGDAHRRMAEIAAIVREPTRDWEMAYLDAALAHLHGDLDAAEARADACLDHAGAVAGSRVTAAWAVQIFAIRADQNRLGELLPALEQLEHDQPGVPAWRAARALAAAQTGDLDGAASAIASVVGDLDDLPLDCTWTGAMTVLARAIALTGGAEAAATVYSRLRPCSGRMSWVGTCTLGPTDTALAALSRLRGDERAATAHLDRAEQLAGHLGAPVFLAEARALRAGAAGTDRR